MASISYSLWNSELAHPTPEERRADRTTDPALMLGFWRNIGPRTGYDEPIAIWIADGQTVPIFQRGTRRPLDVETGADTFQRFLNVGWLKCVAVRKAEWDVAMESGRWNDGKISRPTSIEEQLDIIPTTPADQGGNMSAEEVLSLEQQIAAKVDAELAKANALGAISTMEKATQAAEIVDTVRKLWKIGDTKREEEFRPHKDAADAVQAKWSGPLEKAKLLGTKLVANIEAFKRAEQARLQREADEAARVERERLAAEAQRIRDENDQRIAEANAAGEASPVLEAEPAVQIVAAVVAAPKVSSAFGRAISKPKVKKGRIIDEAKFIKFLRSQADFKLWLQDKADKLARAKLEAPGVETYEE